MNFTLDFTKQADQLIPAIIQDAKTGNVLMLGYMNPAALEKTRSSGKVTFYSRSKKRLWTKGEESGNFLQLVAILADCDQDTLLIKAIPMGPTCHKGTDTCWGEENKSAYGFLSKLESVIENRKNSPSSDSYVAGLFESGLNKVAQKVGEEAIELVIEAKDTNDQLFLAEAADLLFHYLILLQAKGFNLDSVCAELEKRHK